MKKTMLVTGGAGFVGSHSCVALLGWQAKRTLKDMCADAWRWQTSLAPRETPETIR